MKYNRKLFKFNSRQARKLILGRLGIHWKGDILLLDNYNGKMLSNRLDKWDSEHVVPLSLAWRSGFEEQYLLDKKSAMTRMKQFANEERNLIPVAAGSNRSRGSNSLWNWLPLNTHYIPVRNALVRSMYADYGLKLTKTQQWAMDWSDAKILVKYKHGIRMNGVRAWLIDKGLHRILMP